MVLKVPMVFMVSKARLVPKVGTVPKMFLVAMVSMAPIVLKVLVQTQVFMAPNMPRIALGVVRACHPTHPYGVYGTTVFIAHTHRA